MCNQTEMWKEIAEYDRRAERGEVPSREVLRREVLRREVPRRGEEVPQKKSNTQGSKKGKKRR